MDTSIRLPDFPSLFPVWAACLRVKMPAPPPAIAVKEKAPRARLIMKSPLSRLVAAGLLFAAPLLAQEPPPPPAAPAISPEELDQALGPIALYPDALIALI